MTDRARRAVAGASVLALAATGGLWLARVPIATHFIDRELAARGVPAHYRITDLGLGKQRLTDVVIGDPARPDLVADWVETDIGLTLAGPALAAVRAGRVRARGRLVGGKLTLGAIDRLIPQSTGGGPVTLPAINLALADGRLRLDTPYGVAALRLEGQGRVDNGFRGWLGVTSAKLGTGECAVADLRALVAIGSRGKDRTGRPALTFNGPVRIGRLACAGAQVAAIDSATRGRMLLGDVAGSQAEAQLTTGRVDHAATGAAALHGALALTVQHGGAVSLVTRMTGDAVRGGRIGAAHVATDGVARFGGAGGQAGFDGKLRVTDADLRTMVPAVAPVGGPVAPLADRLSKAVEAAARRVSGEVDLLAMRTAGAPRVQVRSLRLSSASGARAALTGAMPLDWRGGDRLLLDARLALAGGGLPSIEARMTRRPADGAIQGVATIAPYSTGDATLALEPVRFDGRGSELHAITRAVVSGPLPDGRVERLSVPLDLRRSGRRWSVNRDCAPVSFQRLAASGLRLDPARLTLCPVGAAMLNLDGGRLGGGVRLGAVRLSGALGGTPLRLASAGGVVRVGARDVTLTGVSALLGPADKLTRIDAAQLSGAVTRDGIGGAFAGAGGQIANVPLVMNAAAGEWRMAGDALTLSGALKVADAAPTPRFQPLDAREVRLALANGTIDAAGTLFEPTHDVKVADVTIAHRLASGAGEALLGVPGITFAAGFQPELLTRITFGVIADVRGTISGDGRIAWNADGVTSTGSFSTAGTDLAAAFGPVEGIAGTIRFTDLLALESAPAQVATVKSINPGVPVTDGRIVYRTLANTRVQVDEGRWPFAGGTLTLEPTLLDFSADQSRRMTFRVERMDAGKFLQQFDFKNLNATGTFDGAMPMVFDASGGRIEDGRLTAREGGGGIAYAGELTEKDLGFWSNLAFQSLRSLTYRSLAVEMSGPLAGEMVTGVRFTGIRQGAEAKTNFLLRRLTRLPIVFNITIRAPFRGLIDSAASFYDPRRLVQRNLQQLLEEQNRRAVAPAGVQPPASPVVPPSKQD